MTVMQIELAVRAYEQGFVCGADPLKGLSRHVVEPETHQHWRAGFAAGRAAQQQSSVAYREQLKKGTST